MFPSHDPEYSKLDDAGRDAFVARYNLNKGGMPTGIMRTNKAGVKERDYRETGGFVPVGVKEKADDRDWETNASLPASSSLEYSGSFAK